MNIPKTIKLIIADDHKMFLDGLSAILSQIDDIKIIAIANNGEEVLNAFKHEIPNVLVTDINMPKMDGLKLTKEIVKSYPTVNILALSMHHEVNIIKSMLKHGVKGYLVKDTDKDELILAIKTVANGNRFISSEIESLLNETQSSPINNKTTAFPSLSEREIEILKYIAEELTQQEIAEKLFISEHTVIFHRRKLLVKLDVKNTAGLIKKAMEMGFLD